FPQYRRLRAHVSAQVEDAHERACPQLRRFEKVAADEVESDSRVGQAVRQPEGVWAVAAARQQCYLRPHLLVGGERARPPHHARPPARTCSKIASMMRAVSRISR